MQGVGYRAYVARVADRLDLSGWVKNLQDGSVEAILQGDKDRVEQGIEFCGKGPPFSKVENLESSPQLFDESLNSFQVT